MLLSIYKTTQERKDYVLEEINRIAQLCWDETLDLIKLTKSKDSSLFHQTKATEGGLLKEELNISSHAKGQLLGRLNIPANYLNKCPEWLQAENINYWICKNHKKKVLLRYNNKEVRAIFSERFNPEKDDHIVFPIVFNALQKEVKNKDLEDLSIQGFYKGKDVTILKAIYKHLIAEHNKETYRAGVCIINSEIGKSALWIKPMILTRSYNFIDSSNEGSTRIIHVGDLNSEKLKKAVQLAKETAEIGIVQLIKAETETISVEEVKDFITQSNNLSSRRLFAILDEEAKEEEYRSKMEFAKLILDSVKELPTFQRYLAEQTVGRFVNLFHNSKARINSILEEAA